MKQVLNADDCREIIYHIADKITENKDYLTELDSAIGDGDHGIGMVGGLQKACEKLKQMSDMDDAYLVFSMTGKAMLMTMGGASGVVFSSMFLAGTRNKPSQPELSAVDLTNMFTDGLSAIKEKGHAKVGDKTMVDALEPAITAMKNYNGNNITEMLGLAVKAALDGLESTENMIARIGRSKSLMERAVGHKDAGAASVWIIFKSMHEWLCDND